MRTKYGEYPEYHTSLDTIGKVVTIKGLRGGLDLAKAIIKEIEKQSFPKATNFCEPFLTKRKMYPTTSKYGAVNEKIKKLLDFLSFCDGKIQHFKFKIMQSLPFEVKEIMKKLIKHKLIENRKSPI